MLKTRINELKVCLKKFEKEQENKLPKHRNKNTMRIKAKNNNSEK